MFDAYHRYAVSWVPSGTDPIAVFGRDWTGWCPEEAARVERRPMREIGSMARGITEDVACSGLHGVIVAPFSLNGEGNAWRLETALDLLAAGTAPVPLGPLRPAIVASRVSLVPASPVAALERVCGRARAALSILKPGTSSPRPNETVGRPAARASFGAARPVPRILNLPADRFHIPLTDELDPFRAERMARALAARLARTSLGSAMIADIALVGDPGGGRHRRVLSRIALGGLPAASNSPALEARGPKTLLESLCERRVDK